VAALSGTGEIAGDGVGSGAPPPQAKMSSARKAAQRRRGGMSPVCHEKLLENGWRCIKGGPPPAGLCHSLRAVAAAGGAVAHRQFKPLLIAGIILWGALSFYAALVVATQIDVHLNLTNRIPSLPVVSKLR